MLSLPCNRIDSKNRNLAKPCWSLFQAWLPSPPSSPTSSTYWSRVRSQYSCHPTSQPIRMSNLYSLTCWICWKLRSPIYWSKYGRLVLRVTTVLSSKSDCDSHVSISFTGNVLRIVEFFLFCHLYLSRVRLLVRELRLSNYQWHYIDRVVVYLWYSSDGMILVL